MIVSQNGNTYVTTGGPLRPDAASPFKNPAEAPAGAAGLKPAWSVLSLQDLNEARRLSAAARPRQEAERIEGQRLLAEQNRARRTSAAAKAEMDRYRNAWETT